MPIESWIALVLLLNMSVYINLGGTDFGGRYLALTTSGARKDDQRAAIIAAIGPMWAANHVLFLLAAGLFFAAFPAAVEVAASTLLIPATLMFGAITVRCSVLFVHQRGGPEAGRLAFWRVFHGVASITALMMLGTALGALASGQIHIDTETLIVRADPVTSWLAPFPLAFGGFLLSLGVLSAAVRVVRVTSDPELVEVFRRRALRAAVGVGALGFTTFMLSSQGAPYLHIGLSGRFWSLPFQIITGSVAIGAIFAIWRGSDALASVLVMAQLALIIWGWGLALQPYLIYPDVKLGAIATSDRTLRFVLGALLVGTILLLVSFLLPKQRLEESS